MNTSMKMEVPTPSWEPFILLPRTERGPSPRAITSPEGVADRLRAAAFAELQAREAFDWAAEYFAPGNCPAGIEPAPPQLCRAWSALARAEERHLGWLLNRMTELGVSITDRPVSDQLWVSLRVQPTPRDFARAMAGAEERGRQAGLRFREQMAAHDPESARIFGDIADEELEHVRLAEKYFPQAPGKSP